jgi:hypothetical protein
MENIYTKLPVKLKVDVKSGKTWGDLWSKRSSLIVLVYW